MGQLNHLMENFNLPIGAFLRPSNVKSMAVNVDSGWFPYWNQALISRLLPFGFKVRFWMCVFPRLININTHQVVSFCYVCTNPFLLFLVLVLVLARSSSHRYLSDALFEGLCDAKLVGTGGHSPSHSWLENGPWVRRYMDPIQKWGYSSHVTLAV